MVNHIVTITAFSKQIWAENLYSALYWHINHLGIQPILSFKYENGFYLLEDIFMSVFVDSGMDGIINTDFDVNHPANT